MKGIPIGLVSSVANPVLQLFTRQNEHLVDMYSGTYTIHSLVGASPTVVVAPTAINTVADKLGTGRYAIATGATAALSVGTHRVTCTFKMAAGGADHIQVIYFEMLDAADWVSTGQYLGYITTKALVDGAQLGTTTRAVMHKHINRESRNIERILGRCFEPRYQVLKLSGNGKETLFLHEAIIAVEKLESAYKDSSQNDILVEFDASSYKVYNRHLDGFLDTDDRRNPKIELVGTLAYEGSEVPPASTYSWPHGEQNLWVTGVFGYTDPTVDSDVSGVSIGETPDDLGTVIQALIYRRLQDPTLSSLGIHSPGALVEVATRDQRAKFAGGGSGSMSAMWTSELTGDPILDRILMRFMAPPDIGYARR